MNRLKRWRHLWLFLVVGSLCLGAGVLVKRQDSSLDLLCSGRTGQLFMGEGKPQWLLSDYDLDLRAEGLGNFRSSARLFDPSSRHVQGYLHHAASFNHARQGRRLLVQVQHSDKSGTDGLLKQQLPGLGLFIFNEQLQLTYRVRRLDPQSVLISSGRGDVLLCKQPLLSR